MPINDQYLESYNRLTFRISGEFTLDDSAEMADSIRHCTREYGQIVILIHFEQDTNWGFRASKHHLAIEHEYSDQIICAAIIGSTKQCGAMAVFLSSLGNTGLRFFHRSERLLANGWLVECIEGTRIC